MGTRILHNCSLRLCKSASISLLALVVVSLCVPPKPSRALPIFARKYNVTCQACHTVPPALNANGRAFQASMFNWPGADSTVNRHAIPLSGMATFSQFDNTSQHFSTPADFRTLEIFTAGGFTLQDLRRGGYFFDYTAALNDGRAGNLDNAFLGIPIIGDNSQLMLAVGQMAPMRYQWNQLNSLTSSAPIALGGAVDAFSFGTTTPAVELDYFDNRMKGTANGNYVTVGVPFEGHLSLNSDSTSGAARGLFATAFTRRDRGSLGAFGYARNSNNLYGLAATLTPRSSTMLLAAVATGQDVFGTSRLASCEADEKLTSRVALTGRVDYIDQPYVVWQTYPVVGITYYPMSPELLRLSAELIDLKDNQTISVFARIQF